MTTGPNYFSITYPAIDELLNKVNDNKEQTLGSKFALASYAASRARQIVTYNAGLSGGLLESVGPLVEYYAQEKPLSIAMREINEGKLVLTPGKEDAALGEGADEAAGQKTSTDNDASAEAGGDDLVVDLTAEVSSEELAA